MTLVFSLFTIWYSIGFISMLLISYIRHVYEEESIDWIVIILMAMAGFFALFALLSSLMFYRGKK